MECKNILAETGSDFKCTQHKNLKIIIFKELMPIRVAIVSIYQ
jgi:hypothetical protein